MAGLPFRLFRSRFHPVLLKSAISSPSRSPFISAPNELQINLRSMATSSEFSPTSRHFTPRLCQYLQNPIETNHDLFSYSSGRFLYNETARLQERYVGFDISALKEAIETDVNRGKVVNLIKFAEGGFNRVLLATLEDGFKVIVKIPYTISVPKKYATASEVATLTFLRSKDIPVPEVYGWSSTAENPVGVEYIIMEYGSGIGSDTRWFDTTKRQKRDLAIEIVEIEKKLFAIPFGSIGSLYFKEDVPGHLRGELYAPGTEDASGDSGKYCIGPIADYMFWYGKRAELDIDRGPWSDPKRYLSAIAKKEIHWTRKFGKPLENDFPHNTIFPGVCSHEDYLTLLNKYLVLAPYILPTDARDPLNKPTIRHPDLTPSNVLVCPETFKVTCIIDWQHTVILPLLLTAGYPKLFENPDPFPPEELKAPEYPEGYDALSTEEKAQVDELIRHQTLFYFYRVFNGGKNKIHLQALRDPLILPRQHLVEYAGRQWTGNLMTLRGALIRMRDYWAHMPGRDENQKCPIDFSEPEVLKHNENEPMWFDLNALVNHWRSELDSLSEEGWVRTEKFPHAVERNQSLKAEFSKDASEDELGQIKRGWPFQDREEVY